MRVEPAVKRVVAFVDGQNLFHAAREAFGYTYPNYGVTLLVSRICNLKGWTERQVRFYTGIPELGDNPFWNHFWTAKLAAMGARGVHTFSRALRYIDQSVVLPDGSTYTLRAGREKGIDVRVALDLVGFAFRGEYDVGLIFSQDQDLTEAVKEVKAISKTHNRWIRLASAYPVGPNRKNRRGISGTDWIPIDKILYDACVDPRDYRPKKSAPQQLPLIP